MVMASLTLPPSMLIAPLAFTVWPPAPASMVNLADLVFSVPCLDADASWIASVNGEARAGWLLPASPPAGAGAAVPPFAPQAESVRTRAAPAATTRVDLRMCVPLLVLVHSSYRPTGVEVTTRARRFVATSGSHGLSAHLLDQFGGVHDLVGGRRGKFDLRAPGRVVRRERGVGLPVM